MSTAVTILLTVLLFGILIFLHEFGHFFTAKLFGIRVNEFALGMGPKLFSFTRGETEYSLRPFPIGGYCAMEGEDEDSSDPKAFGAQAAWKRIIVVAAGAIMNLLLGLLLLAFLLVQKEQYLSNTITGVGDAVVSEQKLLPGDTITAVNGYAVLCDYDFNYAMSRYGGAPMTFTVKRDGEKVTIQNVVIDTEKITGKDNGFVFYVKPIPRTFGSVLDQTWRYAVSIARVVWGGLIDLITGNVGLDAMSGPIGTAEVIGQAAQAGTTFMESLNNLLWIMALLTVNLGIFNLLPVPALDGGRLLFLVFEAIFRKPVPAKYEGLVHMIGFVLLMGLMVVVAFNDILKLFA